MPASKQSHVLALLRASLNLKQSELADLVDCSTATIQAVELNRLRLSNSLAARISAATGANLDWLRSNDLAQPVPPIRALTVQSKLTAAFKNLFAHARLTVHGPERDALCLYIGWELNRLKSADIYPKLTPDMERQIEEMERQWEKKSAKGSRQTPKKDPSGSASQKGLALPPPAPRRTPRSV